jgi:hypothetical protein
VVNLSIRSLVSVSVRESGQIDANLFDFGVNIDVKLLNALNEFVKSLLHVLLDTENSRV